MQTPETLPRLANAIKGFRLWLENFCDTLRGAEFHVRYAPEIRRELALEREKAASREAERDQHEHAVREYKKSGGDDIWRLDYPLSPDSLVFDVGGYKGDFASSIYAMHGCKVMIFEPVERYCEHLRWRFAKNPAMEIFSFGLGGKTGNFTIYEDDDASSLLTGHGKPETIQIMDVAEFLAKRPLGQIDLLKSNIEGGEYDLLERLLDTGLIEKIRYVQVQFHHFVPEADARRNAIRERLAATHRQMWNVDFVWESWERKAP